MNWQLLRIVNRHKGQMQRFLTASHVNLHQPYLSLLYIAILLFCHFCCCCRHCIQIKMSETKKKINIIINKRVDNIPFIIFFIHSVIISIRHRMLHHISTEQQQWEKKIETRIYLPGKNFKLRILKKPIKIAKLLRIKRIECEISLNNDAIRL